MCVGVWVCEVAKHHKEHSPAHTLTLHLPNKQVPTVLNALYQLDIVEEAAFYAWHKKVSKRYVPKDVSAAIRKAATPFVDWLKTADEDSDEDEGEGGASDAGNDDGDAGVVFSEEPQPATTTTTTAAKQEEGDDDDDDIDIDAI